MDGGPAWMRRTNWWGLFFVVGGGAWLLGEMGLFDFRWSLFGPLALVVVGITMLVGGGWDGKEHDDACACTCACCAEHRA